MTTPEVKAALTIRIDENGELITSEDHRNGRVHGRDRDAERTFTYYPLTGTKLLRVESYTILIYDELEEGGEPVRRVFGTVWQNRRYC